MPESRVLVVLAIRSWGMGGLGTAALAVGVAVAEGVADAMGVLLGGLVVLAGGRVLVAGAVVEAGAVDVVVVAGGVVKAVVAALPEQPAAMITRVRTVTRANKSSDILSKCVFENTLVVSFTNYLC